MIPKITNAVPSNADISNLPIAQVATTPQESRQTRQISTASQHQRGNAIRQTLITAFHAAHDDQPHATVDNPAALKALIKQFPDVQILELKNGVWRDADLACLKNCTALRAIKFGHERYSYVNNSFSGHAGYQHKEFSKQSELTAAAVAYLPAALTSLNFSNWTEVPENFLLAIFGRYSKLECLNLADHSFTATEMAAIPSSDLLELNISSEKCRTLDGMQSLLQRLTQLKRLNIAGNVLKQEEAHALSETIVDLDISRCGQSMNIDAKFFIAVLKKLTQLVRLKTTIALDFDKDLLRKELQPLSTLRILDLSGSPGLDDEAAKTLLGLTTNLQTLILFECGVHGAILENELPSLEVVSFGRCRGLRDEGLAQTLPNLPNLSSLNLDGCYHLKGEAFKKLSKEITDLSLHFCDDLLPFGEVLFTWVKLKKLDLSQCPSIINRGLAQYLPESLQILIPAGGSLRPISVKKEDDMYAELRNVLEKCRQLIELDLRSENFLDLATLKKMPETMRVLRVRKGSLNEPEITQLKIDRPNLKIIINQ